MVATALALAAGSCPRPWNASGFCAVAAEADAVAAAAPASKSAEPLVQRVGVTRGICAVPGDAKCEVALRLARASELLVYVQLAQDAEVEAARRAADAAGFYGSRIFVDKGPLARLHLADNVADALIAAGDAAKMPEAEALRVLRPEGKALLGEKELTKPFPPGVDDWSHPYHGPDNNPQSRDQVARAPYLTQFLADPRYAPLPQLAVASAGRVFKAFGHIAFKTREEPWLNTLAAFNGYNGTLLWRRETAPALMVHRNTMIATPTTLYFADDKSCKLFDAATGALQGEIAPPATAVGGTFWKWMALENGVLYALIGEQEERDPVLRYRLTNHGWPWDPLSPGFNRPEHTWGYGRSLVAIDLKTKKALWVHMETEPIDSRGLCMNRKCIYAFRHGAYLSCIDARSGRELWRKTKDNAPALFEAIGPYLNRQDWRTNWRTTAYLRCSDMALYFAGPPIGQLLAVDADDGRILWQHPYGNYQLVLHADGLYALSGQIDSELSRKFDPITGQVLAEIKLGRRACTRPTGAIDAVFCRANGGSTRLDAASNEPGLVSPMRAQCQDGVTIANGLLYWWPSVCDCNLTLYGITCLGPAGKFDFAQPAVEGERLELGKSSAKVPLLAESPADWPTFRANNIGTVTTEAALPEKARQVWRSAPPAAYTPTAPTAAGGLVFLSGSDGVVRALDAGTGKPRWRAYTGGAVRYPPTIWQGRAFVGSGDGWVYAFAARDGRLLWRFRAAPAERWIPVYGALHSTWPAASGVLVADGVAYVAAGIVNYDGTHVYALDAATGKLKWQNNSSGHLNPEARTGVSVQGHLMFCDGKLYLAGGNVVSPAIYDAKDGQCLNTFAQVHRRVNNNVPASESPRGCDLYQIAGTVRVAGKPFYAHPKYPVYDSSVFNKTLVASLSDRDLTWVNNNKLSCYARIVESRDERLYGAWGKPAIAGLAPLWERDCKESLALAVGRNAAVLANASELVALDLKDGRVLWQQSLPAPVVPWGLAVDRDGRVLAALEGGQVLCFGRSDLMAMK